MGRAAPPARFAAALLLGLAGPSAVASAQSQGLVVRDGSLRAEPPQAVGAGLDPEGHWANYLITPEMGEQRGGNLFHSFVRFGIGTGETATFTGPDPIAGPQSVSNVISRVTGGDPSQIDGTLRSTIPGADVWLLNPSGVVFGEGATLDVKGSFHAGAADYVSLGEGGLERFYGDPSRPSVLATAPPATFGFLPDTTHAAELVVDRGRLEVGPGEALELMGGDLSLTGAELVAPGGHVALEAADDLAISQSLVDVGRAGDTPGSISIRGGQIVIEGSSKLLAENESPIPPTDPEKEKIGPGLISVVARESLVVDASLLSASASSAGNAGAIEIEGGEIVLRGGGPGLVDISKSPTHAANLPHRNQTGMRAETSGSGSAGRIEIEAEAVAITDGAGVSAQTVGADESGRRVEASGRAGTVRIEGADSVNIANGGFVSVESWSSRGDAGSIEIDEVGALTVDGDWLTTLTASSLGATSRLQRSPELAEGRGRAGNIEIGARSVTLMNGGLIQSTCFDCPPPGTDVGRGRIHIEAETLHAEGHGTLGSSPRIFAGTGSGVRAATLGGAGDAGSVEIELTGSLRLLRGGFLSVVAADEAAGNAGRVSVHAKDVIIEGGDPAKGSGIYAYSGLAGFVGTASGEAGVIEVVADSLELRSGAGGSFISVENQGDGRGGRVAIQAAKSVTIASGGFVNAHTNGAGDAGTITIDSQDVQVMGEIHAGTAGSGLGGQIALRADSIAIEDGGLVDAGTTARGIAGSITMDAHSVAFRSGGSATTNSRNPGSGSGNAGTIEITATDSILLDHEDGPAFSLRDAANGILHLTGIFSATGGGDGGSIRLVARDITVANGAIVATSTVGGGDAGHVDLSGDRIHILNGGFVDSTSVPNPDSHAPGSAAGSVEITGNELIEVVGGRRVMPGDVEYEERSRVSSAALGSGAAGRVTLTAPRVVVDGGAVAITALASQSAGGTIQIDAGELVVTNGGRIDASSFVAAPGGSIGLTASDTIVISGSGSGIASRTGGEGTGGDVTLRAPRIELIGGAEASAESAPGLGAIHDIFASLFEEGLIPAPPESATGNAGSITFHADRLVHLDASEITTSVGAATGGDISIDPVFVILENGSRILATADTGHGGFIRITTDHFFAFPGSVVSADSNDQQLSGTVEIHSPDVDLAGDLTPLPSGFLDATSLMRARCAARRHGERAGSFAVRGPGGIPAEPDGWLPAPLVLDAAATAAAPAAPVLLASLPGRLLAHAACQ